MTGSLKLTGARLLLGSCLLTSSPALAEVPGVASGIPEPEHRNAIVQLFNWPFTKVEAAIPTLRALGYSHVHVSPPQKSNDHVADWWGRYQPVDFGVIAGPLGTEDEFRRMNDAAEDNGIQIIADVVLNHMASAEGTDYLTVDRARCEITAEKFPQFDVADFHKPCGTSCDDRTCWLFGALPDLKTEAPRVRQVAKEYLAKLAGLGVDGFRFDAARHIEPGFFPEVLKAAPGKYAFGEIVLRKPEEFTDYLNNAGDMDFYDFPLLATMTPAFGFGGDLSKLKEPARQDPQGALEGPRAITFVRNHDIDRGQNTPGRGIDDPAFNLGWDPVKRELDLVDVRLAYAFVLGREDGFPYVFADMPEAEKQDDRYDDGFLAAAIRFHNLCLPDTGGIRRRPEKWLIEEKETIGWQRGDDRLVVINKQEPRFEIRDLRTTLQPGKYREVHEGWRLDVQADGTIAHWSVPPRSAVMFVRITG